MIAASDDETSSTPHNSQQGQPQQQQLPQPQQNPPAPLPSQLEQTQQQLEHVVVTVNDLDVEDAEQHMLQAIEAKDKKETYDYHDDGPPTTTATNISSAENVTANSSITYNNIRRGHVHQLKEVYDQRAKRMEELARRLAQQKKRQTSLRLQQGGGGLMLKDMGDYYYDDELRRHSILSNMFSPSQDEEEDETDGLMKIDQDHNLSRIGLRLPSDDHDDVRNIHARQQQQQHNDSDCYIATTKDGIVVKRVLSSSSSGIRDHHPSSSSPTKDSTQSRHHLRPGSWRRLHMLNTKNSIGTDSTSSSSASGIYYHYYVPRTMRELCSMCHPVRVLHNVHDILAMSYFWWVGVPCLVSSAFFFYLLDDPKVLKILPDDTTIAVWLLLIARQSVTLGLAQLSVFIVVDGFLLGTHLGVKTLGPLLTLAAERGKGWPLFMCTWAVWNLVLIHGDTAFQLNWLYWTDIELFHQNFGGLLVNSTLYTHILFSAIIAGLSISIKRTIFALRFGNKQVEEFKPRLKRILADIVLISEIATLAEQSERILLDGSEKDGSDNDDDTNKLLDESGGLSWELMPQAMVQQNLNNILWVPQIDYQDSNVTEDDKASTIGGHGEEREAEKMIPGAIPISRITSSGNYTRFANSKNRAYSLQDDDAAGRQKPQLQRSEFGRLKIKDMLDSWEVPEETNKFSNNSIHEILKFRRVLAHLDDEKDAIFGKAFGSTATRDECLKSGHSVYYRLLKLSQDADKFQDKGDDDGNLEQPETTSDVLPFDVLALLCLNEDGKTYDFNKKRKIKKLFTPDRAGGLPLLAFIQATDQSYKRLVFLRASLRNSKMLDGVLKRLFNGIFYFFLTLFLLSLMHLNPWPLIVSITSIVVSVSFALGSSVSRFVEGVWLIAIRRPYDLGDRIIFANMDVSDTHPDPANSSWFVEDISLATTTLRFARTNEVCTVNNSSISSKRIVNLARSLNAGVHVEFQSHISIVKGEKLLQFRQAIHRYVEERPRVWESVVHIRHDIIDADSERVDICIGLRHRNSWQAAGRIKLDRSNFYRFLYELGVKLDVHFFAPAEQKVVYQGGILRRGGNDELDVRDMLRGSNICSVGNPGRLFLP